MEVICRLFVMDLEFVVGEGGIILSGFQPRRNSEMSSQSFFENVHLIGTLVWYWGFCFQPLSPSSPKSATGRLQVCFILISMICVLVLRQWAHRTLWTVSHKYRFEMCFYRRLHQPSSQSWLQSLRSNGLAEQTINIIYCCWIPLISSSANRQQLLALMHSIYGNLGHEWR